MGEVKKQGKTAFLFAGQGAQYAGMGKSMYEASPAARAVFDAADSIRPGTVNMCFYGDKAQLSLTSNTQPCMFAVDLACAKALAEAGIKADGAAGFSLGEVAAVAFCGVLSKEEAFGAVCKRAELMSEMAEKHPGAMTAVLKLDAKQVEEIAARHFEVFPVNYNCSGQTVVAANSESIDAFEADVKLAGGRAMRLAVSGAFHSPYMTEAADAFAKYLESKSFLGSEIPLYANSTAQIYPTEKSEQISLLSGQINSPVRWQKTIENMIAQGFDTFIEVGPGKTLSGLVKKISGEVAIYNVENSDDVTRVVSALKGEQDAGR